MAVLQLALLTAVIVLLIILTALRGLACWNLVIFCYNRYRLSGSHLLRLNEQGELHSTFSHNEMQTKRGGRWLGLFRRFQRRCLEDFRRDDLPLCQSCKDNSLRTVVSRHVCHDGCLSQYSFVSTTPVSWRGRRTSEVCRPSYAL